MEQALMVICLCLAGFGSPVRSDQEEQWAAMLLNNKPDLLPTRGPPVEVSLGLDLTDIREVDTARGEIEILAMRTLGWKNPFLAWRRSDRHEDPLSIDIKRIWSPDIVAYNQVHAPELLSPPLAVVAADGQTFFVPNERVRFRCDLSGLDTLDGSNCTLRYGSWTHHGGQITVTGSDVTTDDFRAPPGLELVHTYTEVEVKRYPCCPEAYPSVLFTLTIRRESKLRRLFDW